MSEHESAGNRDLAAEVRLRPERPPVTRLSRRVLIGLMGVVGISISGVLIFALNQGPRKANSATELFNTAHKSTADGLATLPRDYTGLARDVPVLGPPLPGDLGRPIRNAQLNAPGEPAIDVEQQRAAQETEAARTSRQANPGHSFWDERMRPATQTQQPTPQPLKSSGPWGWYHWRPAIALPDCSRRLVVLEVRRLLELVLRPRHPELDIARVIAAARGAAVDIRRDDLECAQLDRDVFLADP